MVGDAPAHPRQAVASLDTAGSALASLKARFAAAELPTPGLDARLLVGHALQVDGGQVLGRPDRPLSADEQQRLATFSDRRLAREPVSRIIGMREFWGLSFAIGQATLDPRPDTETLVAAALMMIDREGWRQAPLRILDLGTGSGCILLALLWELPHAVGIGTDISLDALLVANSNARALGLDTRAQFLAGSWAAGLRAPFDLVVSNPPYIEHSVIANLAPEVALYEPAASLDGGEDGLNAYRAILAGLSVLQPKLTLFEVGAGQADVVCDLLGTAFRGREAPCIERFQDHAGIERVVAAKSRGLWEPAK